MKMKYEEPEMKVVKFETPNVMLTLLSDGDGDSGEFGELFGD